MLFEQCKLHYVAITDLVEGHVMENRDAIENDHSEIEIELNGSNNSRGT